MIRLVRDPQEYFLLIRDGLLEAMKHSGGYVSIGQIHQALREGVWRLYLVTGEDEEYLGFGIVEPLPLNNGTWLNVPFAYCKDGLYGEFFDHLTGVALKEGFVGVKFVSGRPGFSKIAERYGWKTGFVEYIVKEF
jgi:hypothetical protein